MLRRRSGQGFGGFTASACVVQGDQGEILGLIAERLGKSTIFNMLSGTFRLGRSINFDGRFGLAPPGSSIAALAGPSDSATFRRLTIFENVALAGYFGQGGTVWQRPRKRERSLAWSACRRPIRER